MHFQLKIMTVNFKKYPDGLVPAIIQDFKTYKVLMLGFMNETAMNQTIREGKVTFYSRSKKRLWTKGEESGNYLLLKDIMVDCDNDSLLVKVFPVGPVCHTGADTCWNETNQPANFIEHLEEIIEIRKKSDDPDSYVSRLFSKGINKIAQKVGEEAVELVIESKDSDNTLFINEAADLLFHYLLLLNAKGYNLQSVVDILQKRHTK